MTTSRSKMKFISWGVYVLICEKWVFAGCYRAHNAISAIRRFTNDSGHLYKEATHITAKPYKDGEPDGLQT